MYKSNCWGRGGQWTHPKGCVLCTVCTLCVHIHCECIYTAGGGSVDPPATQKDVHTMLRGGQLGVSGPTRQRMCTDSWGPRHPPPKVLFTLEERALPPPHPRTKDQGAHDRFRKLRKPRIRRFHVSSAVKYPEARGRPGPARQHCCVVSHLK